MNRLIDGISKKIVKMYYSLEDVDQGIAYYLAISFIFFFVWQLILMCFSVFPVFSDLLYIKLPSSLDMAISKFLEFSFFMFIGNCVYFIKSSSKGNNGFKKFVYDPFSRIELLTSLLNNSNIALKDSEERFRKLIESNSDALILVDSDGIMRYVNYAMIKITGYKYEDLIGTQFGFPLEEDASLSVDLITASNDIKHAEIKTSKMELNGSLHYVVSMREFSEKNNFYKGDVGGCDNGVIMVGKNENFGG